ncbi:MAG: peptidoglycan DD-metalloendopeptidase family protein [Phycisphaerales bacterium]
MRALLVLSCLLTGASSIAHAGASGFGGGELRLEPDGVLAHDCLLPAERAALDRLVAQRLASETEGPRGNATFPRMPFFPQAGRLHRDLIVTNYVDLDPGAGILDWDCGGVTYNGHGGHDVVVRSFAEQEVGVPVYAALDGMVIATADGNPDMNTSWNGQPANFVVISHSDGVVSYSFHLKNGSVSVVNGEQVRAGQQIGLTASSGVSTYPHIHFEVRQFGSVMEPSAGACRSGASLWTHQAPTSSALTVFDAGITDQGLAPHPGPPWMLPRTGQIEHGDAQFTLWIMANRLPAGSTWQLRVYRPDGSIASNGAGVFNNPAYNWSWWWWSRPTSIMLGQTGTARAELTLNGGAPVVLEFEVTSTGAPAINRDPSGVAASLVPAGALSMRSPWEDEVILCEIDVDLVNDDPDYDVVRYEYVWEVNDVEVRRVTSAAHSDALAAGVANAGDTVRCTVTPSDGRGGTGPSASATAEVVSACPTDTNGDRVVNFADLNGALSDFGAMSGVGGLAADVNLDGIVNFADLNEILSTFGDVCE